MLVSWTTIGWRWKIICLTLIQGEDDECENTRWHRDFHLVSSKAFHMIRQPDRWGVGNLCTARRLYHTAAVRRESTHFPRTVVHEPRIRAVLECYILSDDTHDPPLQIKQPKIHSRGIINASIEYIQTMSIRQYFTFETDASSWQHHILLDDRSSHSMPDDECS